MDENNNQEVKTDAVSPALENGAVPPQPAPESEGFPFDSVMLEEAGKAGVLYGRKKSKTHPRMRPYIYTTRNGMEIFDFSKIYQSLERACGALKEAVKRRELILVVGAKPAAQDLVKAFAEKFRLPAVTNRWLGGTLTNFKTISRRIQHYLTLKADRDTGKLAKYTKKERGKFDEEIKRLETLFGGLESLTEVPRMLIIVDPVEHDTAVREARRLAIPVIALMSSDGDPTVIAYPVPGNGNARSSIAWFLKRFEGAVEKGLAERAAAKAAGPEKASV